jgi:2-C-methyl-D-erythritol 4-phosphate cytidylyltransferase
MSKYAVILPAAGKGTRFSDKRKKVFVELKGRPVWVRTAEQFVNREDVIQTILVVSPDDLDWFKEKFRPNLAFMDVEVVTGGAERFDSVLKGLERVRPEADFVAVHDAARPLIVKDWIDQVFRAAEQHNAAILATPVTSTLKRVDGNQLISATVSRDHLWAAQTPQVFRRQLLLDAYAKRGSLHATDEAQLVENLGHRVKIVTGSALNLKITTLEDLRIAEHLLDALPKEKLPGFLHPFADDRLGSLD